MAKKTNRLTITLACEGCKRRNYTTSKNKANTADRLLRRKFCKWCKGQKAHKETK